MKTGNVILAIFLWLCIPIALGVGFAFDVFGRGNGVCTIGAPLILFVLGLVVLFTGIENKPQSPSIKPLVIQQSIQPSSSSQQEVIQQPSKDATNIKQGDIGVSMFNRQDFLYGIAFIGVGILVLVLSVWIEPLIITYSGYQWLILILRIAGLIGIIAGIVGIIASLIPRK
jgi:hypothetical protein